MGFNDRPIWFVTLGFFDIFPFGYEFWLSIFEAYVIQVAMKWIKCKGNLMIVNGLLCSGSGFFKLKFKCYG